MVFCSLVAYDPDDPRRDWAERCLEKLLKQMDSDDAFLKVEALGRRWEDCLPYKVKTVQAALEITEDFACLVDTDILFRSGWVKALKEFMHSTATILLERWDCSDFCWCKRFCQGLAGLDTQG